MRLLSLSEGVFLVKLARQTIETYLTKGAANPPENVPDSLREKRGVFVTLRTYPDNELRGCIGFPTPIHELVDATMKAAISAATEDPRFPPLSREELGKITVEVSVLTPPEEIKYSDPRELPKLIKIGVDGLIIEAGVFSGLLLPQVPVEYNWSPEEYLMNLCMKAGLPATYWLTGKARIYHFTAQIFEEESPNGKIIEKKLQPKQE